MKVKKVSIRSTGLTEHEVICEQTKDWENENDIMNIGFFLGILSVQDTDNPFMDCVEIIDYLLCNSNYVNSDDTEFYWDIMVLRIKNPI
jgi:hypothetical protein